MEGFPEVCTSLETLLLCRKVRLEVLLGFVDVHMPWCGCHCTPDVQSFGVHLHPIQAPCKWFRSAICGSEIQKVHRVLEKEHHLLLVPTASFYPTNIASGKGALRMVQVSDFICLPDRVGIPVGLSVVTYKLFDVKALPNMIQGRATLQKLAETSRCWVHGCWHRVLFKSRLLRSLLSQLCLQLSAVSG